MNSEKILYREVNYKYILAGPYSIKTEFRPIDPTPVEGLIHLSPAGRLLFRPGYAFDGPSGPTFDTKTAMRAALVHDGLYQLMREGYLQPYCRKAADELFFRILRADGMGKLRSLLWWRGVRRFAAFAIKPQDDSVKVAP